MDKKYEIVKFIDDEFELDVRADKENETVWLRAGEMAALFNVNRPAIIKHISNILNDGELDSSTCSFLEQVQKDVNRNIKTIVYFTLVISSFINGIIHIMVYMNKEKHMNQEKIRNYAKLIATVGINIQKGQEVDLTIEVEQVEFARILIDELYNAGASKVNMNWTDTKISRIEIEKAELERISHLQSFEKAKQEYNIEKHPARLYIESEDPDALKGVDQERYGKIISSKSKEIRFYRNQYDDYCQWCIAGVPGKEWAKKVFPNMSDEDAIEALWTAILKTSRAYDGDPVENWTKHNEALTKHANYLNKLNLRKLHYYSSNGTDLYVELMDDVKWLAGGESTKGTNIPFQPNIPTEECFTTPHRLKTNGIVYSTKPLSYRGELVENFNIRFENGKAVEIHAEKGEELLKNMITLDENACYLGECALVPFHSPINDSGVLFYSTLYDENASCHLALGRGFDMLLENEDKYTEDEKINKGINYSIVHTDFMIGSSDLCIDGIDKDGVVHKVFVNGDWGLDFNK